jgi:hypothetical protein
VRVAHSLCSECAQADGAMIANCHVHAACFACLLLRCHAERLSRTRITSSPNSLYECSSVLCSFLGEWKHSQEPASPEEKASSSKNCFIIAAVYGGTLVLSIIGLIYHRTSR